MIAPWESLDRMGQPRSWRRILSLMKKEGLQILRDPSSIVIAFGLPVVLLFLFTFGVSMDVENLDVGVVVEGNSAEADEFLHTLVGSRYFRVHVARNRRQVEDLLVGGRLQAVVVIPADFARRLRQGRDDAVQVVVRGTDAATAEIVRGYLEGAWQSWWSRQVARHSRRPARSVEIEPRVWFNEAALSRMTLLPGSIAVVMTLIGTMLTSLVVAREWERGTLEALLTTPLTRMEFFLGKFLPFFALGLGAMGLVTVVSVLVFRVPLRGSIPWLVLVTACFLGYAQGLGLLISTVTRNQFAATLAALVTGFLPAFILSGLVFELDSMPWLVRMLTYIFPPRYFVHSLRTLFLVGDVVSVLLPDTFILAFFAVISLGLTLRRIPLRLDA